MKPSPKAVRNLEKEKRRWKAVPRPRGLSYDGGWGLDYKIEGDILTMKTNLTEKGRPSRTGKSLVLASSRGPYWLKSLGQPNVFVIVSVCRSEE